MEELLTRINEYIKSYIRDLENKQKGYVENMDNSSDTSKYKSFYYGLSMATGYSISVLKQILDYINVFGDKYINIMAEVEKSRASQINKK